MLVAVTLVHPSDGSKGKAVSAVAKQMKGKEITRDNLTAALRVHALNADRVFKVALVAPLGRPTKVSPEVMELMTKEEYIESMQGNSIQELKGHDISARIKAARLRVAQDNNEVLNPRALSMSSLVQMSVSTLYRIMKKVAPLTVLTAGIKTMARYQELKAHFSQLAFFIVYNALMFDSEADRAKNERNFVRFSGASDWLALHQPHPPRFRANEIFVVVTGRKTSAYI
jgi:hypothetical protein